MRVLLPLIFALASLCAAAELTIPELRRHYYQLRAAECNATAVKARVNVFRMRKEAALQQALAAARDRLKEDIGTAAGNVLLEMEKDIAAIDREITALTDTRLRMDACVFYSYSGEPDDAASLPKDVSLTTANAEIQSRAAMDNDARLNTASLNLERLTAAREWYARLLSDAIAGMVLAYAESGRDVRLLEQLELLRGKFHASADSSPARRATDFHPARYIQIFENNYKERILLYDPRRAGHTGTTQLTADADSEIVIQVDPSLMGEEIALNRLLITAKLLHGSAAGQNSKEQDIEVAGYSEIAKDPQNAASQNAVAFRTAETIQNTVQNMYYTTRDIVYFVYKEECGQKLAQNPLEPCYVPEDIDPQAVNDRFRLYKPEIDALSEFFSNAENTTVAEAIGGQIFGIDPASLKRIAKQYKADLDTLLGSAVADKANATARTDLLERTKLIWYDFGFLRQQIANMKRELERDPEPCPDAQRVFPVLGRIPDDTATTCWINYVWKAKIRNRLKEKLVPGTISLGKYDPQDGDTVTLRVEARESNGTVIGNPAIFKIVLKYYDWKFRISPSLLFIHRQGTTNLAPENLSDEDKKTVNPGAKPVNFAPAPGVTAAITFHKRPTIKSGSYKRIDRTKGAAIMDFLSPGVGMNVSFLNFEQRDFDAATGKFSKTQSTSVQVGAGVVGSLFGNKLQFVYGWNLNSLGPRSYIGIGFGFLEVGKAIASVTKAP